MRIRAGVLVTFVCAFFLGFQNPAVGQLLNLLYQKDGDSSGVQLGISVAGAGDVDGDGKGDFIIGAWGSPPPGTRGGAAYVYSGATGGLLYQKGGDGSGYQFGSSVASAGDVNGDGRSDFIIGDNLGGFGNFGTANVYSGADGGLLYQKLAQMETFWATPWEEPGM